MKADGNWKKMSKIVEKAVGSSSSSATAAAAAAAADGRAECEGRGELIFRTNIK